MSTHDLPSVSVVTVCYNHSRYLAAYIESLRASAHPIAEIIVVDNASTDDSLKVLRSFDGVTVLANATNIGYSAALNQALAHARSPLVCATGPDVVVAPGWLEPLLAPFAHDPEGTFAVASRVLTLDRREVQSAGGSLHFSGHLCVFDMWRPAGDGGAEGGEAYEVGAIDSTSALFDRAKFLAIGGCDEDFFVYHEEFDYCYRARARGWRCYYQPRSVVYHGEGSAEFSVRSGGEYPRRRPFLHTRNRLLAVLKNYRLRTLVAIAPPLAALELLNVVLLARMGLHGAYFDALGWLWRHRKEIALRRYATERGRTVDDGALLAADALTITPLLLGSPALRAAKTALDMMLAMYWTIVRKVLFR
jgi:GT2 family glycosyltransferase